MDFLISVLRSEIMTVFMILSLGYIIGRISFFGIKFGGSAILIISLFFGHFGFEISPFLSTIGLVLFLTPIGLMAGPDFIANIKRNGVSFLMISLVTCVVGGLCIVIATKFFDIPLALSMGLATGALTSTSMLGTVKSLTDSIYPAVGYGITYAFGVIGVVLFVQLLPRLYKINKDEENAKLIIPHNEVHTKEKDETKLITIDSNGLFPVAIAAVIGIIIGRITIPVGESVKVSLGNGGGTLIAGLILGHFGSLGKINLKVSKERLSLVRDFGLALFLMQSGLKAGAGFVTVLGEYGIKLFLIGAMMTLSSAIISFIFAYYVFKLPLFAALGTTTGAMTSAPSLGALLTVAEDDKVASFYAACQPTATVMLVFLPQIIALFMTMN